MNRPEYVRWALFVLNRSAELRWKLGEPPEPDEPAALQTDIDVARLRKAYGPELEHILHLHRDVLEQERARSQGTPDVSPRPAVEVVSAPPVWEREPW